MSTVSHPLTLGARTTTELVADLDAARIRRNAYGERLLGAFGVASSRRSVAVVISTARGFGFEDGATLDELFRRGSELGLEPCPLEVAVLLRLAWVEEPVWPRITVASTRIWEDPAEPRGFYLRDDPKGCWLRGFVASDDWCFSAEERLALLRR